MKLTKLEINGYKNLGLHTIFNFENCSNYVALIGLNGSGKSNILEAVSKIVHSYHYKQNILSIDEGGFEFLLEYEIDERKIKLQNNQIFVNNKLRKRNVKQHLPSQIIACYSGEETRLWEDVFAQPYTHYFNKVKLNYLNQKLRFLYINKDSWEIALLTLLCHSGSQEFIKNLIGIDDLQDVNITFGFAKSYESRKAKFSIADTSELTIPQFTDRIKNEQEQEAEGILKISQIATIDLGNLQNENHNNQWCRKLFDFLFLATMRTRKKLITNIKIEFNNKDVRKLSEGEKKIILIKTISSILADNNSIVLYDEPDVSLHISRKIEIKNLIEDNNHFTLLTTHSPKLIKELYEKNVFIINGNSDRDDRIISATQVDHLNHISDGEFSLMDYNIIMSSRNPTLLVEGKFDLQILKTALLKLNLQKYRPLERLNIFPIGGASGLRVFYNLIKNSNSHEKIIALLDNDGAGNAEIKEILSVDEIEELRRNDTLEKDNFHFLMLPRLARINDSQFEIEDYFNPEILQKISKELIDTFRVLKNFTIKKDTIKKKFNENLENLDSQEFEDFKVLFDKLIEIINQV
ncbi:AAA family ATPase [Flavobacterium antarcticum]|uniref:AAA family ATPase n=1 Tax=Flavobacterium antarcticum TaxID=271155 RepID=UPI000429651E|nr:AAA family ATPase [Flavobacterium antarcticum]